MDSTTQKKWYEGTNFWVAAFMVAFGMFTGLQETDIREVVNFFFGGVGIFFALREKVKSGGINFKAWLSKGNTWNYLIAVITVFLPDAPPSWANQLNEIANGIITQNYTGLLGGIAAFGISLFYFIRDRKNKQPAPATS